eukprot:GFYU01003636.1.p1 GENE.GFYU01003636.1~~GFYU01003636.1.p1  ORF type:complete len:477 (-),score=156.77 GFYU01003636.1:131-1516(-)
MSSSTPAIASGTGRQFDLEVYIANYAGHTKIDRLAFIAEQAESVLKPEVSRDVSMEAYRLALEELKKTSNATKYKELTEKAAAAFGAETFSVDEAWIESVQKKSEAREKKLDMELHAYKQNLIKESIRMGHNDLGDFHYDCGDLTQALKSYFRTRDYCTTAKHIIQMCLNVIKVCVEMQNFNFVSSYVTKAESGQEASDPTIAAKLKACSGLANLESGKYKYAARKFLETGTELASNFSEVIVAHDVAVYGGLCALATFDRQELKIKVLDNTVFKNFLELVPEVRELINDFYSSRYSSCLDYLSALKPELMLDIHLYDHVEKLYSMIRNKALIQYFMPYVSVDLNHMAAAFKTTVASLENELADLIMNNLISARIDSHNKILYAKHADQRTVTYNKAAELGSAYLRHTQSTLLRIDMLRNDIIVKKESGHGGASGYQPVQPHRYGGGMHSAASHPDVAMRD